MSVERCEEKNPLNLFKRRIGYCSVQIQYIELAIRSMQKEHEKELRDDKLLVKLSNEYGLTLATYDSDMVLNGISKSYLIMLSTYFDFFLKEIIKYQKNYCSSYDGDRKDSESYLGCVMRNMESKKLDEEIKSLKELCEYYRIVRNDAVHLGDSKDKIDFQ